MAHLRPCTVCQRHVRASETRCPFCDAELAEGVLATPKLSAPLTRAAILFASATTVAACVGGPEPGPTSSSSSSSGTASSSGSSGDPVPAYGAPAIDSGDPNANDSGGPVALYGPAPVDGG